MPYAVPQSSGNRGVLQAPQQLFKLPAPVSQAPQPRLNQVSSLLNQNDHLMTTSRQQAQPNAQVHLFSRPTLHPLSVPAANKSPSIPIRLHALALFPDSASTSQRQQIIVNSGLKEWRSGVRETEGSNKGPRINTYAQNAKFGKGYEWCGFFTAFNFSQAGFKYPESFASYQKARDFFMYRSYTSRDPGLHRDLDQLRQNQQSQGSTRQYFIMAESPTPDYVKAYKSYYSHIDLPAMTHSWQNIPIQAGDVALFSHGHVGLVVSYDARTGKLETVEGNTTGKGPDGKNWSQAVVRKSYDLSTAQDRKRFDGFGRAANSDFA